MHPTDVHPYIHAYTLAHTHAHLDVLTGIQDMIKLGQLHPNPSLPLNMCGCVCLRDCMCVGVCVCVTACMCVCVSACMWVCVRARVSRPSAET